MQAALADRFRKDVVALTAPGARYGLAVSGGPDSVAMLLLAHAAFPGRIEVATCDHRLRAESAEEAHFVAALCAERGILHRTLPLEIERDGNVSQNARHARYAALETWSLLRDLPFVLTAHHADDQLETVIMRLNRGSGVKGLAGIRAVRGRVVRPLLRWRHSELAAIVADAGIRAVDDPSNGDDRYDRARLRKALAGADWLDPLAVVRSAAACADADDALDQRNPRELIRRAVVAELRRVEPGLNPRGLQIDSVIDALTAGQTVTVGNVLCIGEDPWRFAPAPPRRAIAPKTPPA